MKGFVLRILVLFLSVFVIDRVAGKIMAYWIERVPSSYLGKDNYICDYCDEDILIFGSSRAEYHYNAKMMEDSLGTTTYNCGTSGFGILLSYGRLQMIYERYTPKYIIMEVTPEFDYADNGNVRKDFQHLRRHYDRKGVRDIFEDIDSGEKYKMLSYLYRYNSDYIHNPIYLLKTAPIDKNAMGIQGFIPEDVAFDSMKVGKVENSYEIDEIKYTYLKKFMELANTQSCLVVVISPYLLERDPQLFNPIRQLADSLDIPFIDYSNNPKYVHQTEFFKDGVHLNSKGADEFTRDVIREMKVRRVVNGI